MSVLPIGSITDVRPVDYVRQAEAAKPPGQEAPKAPAQAVDVVNAQEELSFGIQARGQSDAAEREYEVLAHNLDPRQFARQAYRITRLKGVYAPFDDQFWSQEVGPRADELLKTARKDNRVQSLLDFLKDDPFRLYVYLLEARQRCGGVEPEAGRLNKALELIWDEYESAIVAGFNTMAPMARFAKNVDEWNRFRGIYLECISNGDLAKTYKALLDRFGPGRLREAIHTLRNAIAADLNSPIVCADKDRWQQEHLDLVDNRRISSLIASGADFCREVLARDPVADTVVSFVGGALELASSPTERKLDALCAILISEEAVDELLRWRVRRYLKKYVPLWLWSSPEARDLVLFPQALRLRV